MPPQCLQKRCLTPEGVHMKQSLAERNSMKKEDYQGPNSEPVKGQHYLWL